MSLFRHSTFQCHEVPRGIDYDKTEYLVQIFFISFLTFIGHKKSILHDMFCLSCLLGHWKYFFLLDKISLHFRFGSRIEEQSSVVTSEVSWSAASRRPPPPRTRRTTRWSSRWSPRTFRVSTESSSLSRGPLDVIQPLAGNISTPGCQNGANIINNTKH